MRLTYSWKGGMSAVHFSGHKSPTVCAGRMMRAAILCSFFSTSGKNQLYGPRATFIIYHLTAKQMCQT